MSAGLPANPTLQTALSGLINKEIAGQVKIQSTASWSRSWPTGYDESRASWVRAVWTYFPSPAIRLTVLATISEPNA